MYERVRVGVSRLRDFIAECPFPQYDAPPCRSPPPPVESRRSNRSKSASNRRRKSRTARTMLARII